MGNESDTQAYEPTHGPGRPSAPSTKSAPATDLSSEYQATARLGSAAEPTPTPTPATPTPTPSTPQPSGNSWTVPGTGIGPGLILFGKYEVIRQLGKGGMGAVWLVRHCDLNVQRALKTIEEAISDDPEAHSRFRREAEVMARFIHPHAVTVHDARLTSGDVAFIEMELVEGQPLHKFLRAGIPMPLDWISRILEQLCDVLQVASDKGIVHRDLKPSNLMLLDGLPPGREHLKVLDFGIAKLVGDDARRESSLKTTGYLGTPSYSSPEQCKGHDRPDTPIDARSDLYSVGVILYEWLTGHRPFVGNAVNVLHDQIHTPPPPFSAKTKAPRGGPALEQFTLRCLAKSPAHRPQSARQLYLEFLAALAKDEPTFIPKPTTRLLDGSESDFPSSRIRSLVGTTSKPGERLRITIATIAAIAFVAAAITIALIFILPNPQPQPSVAKNGEVKKSITKDEPLQAPRISAGYRGEGTANATSGLFDVIVRESDQARFKLHPETGHYIPEGYSVDPNDKLAKDGWPAILRDATGAKYLRIPADPQEFRMGSFQAGAADHGDKPAVTVRLDGYYLQETEATHGQVDRFFANHPEELARLGLNPKAWAGAFDDLVRRIGSKEEARRYPATNVTRTLAEAVARSLGGNLPLEAQWEYAARSGGLSRPQIWGDAEPKFGLANIDNLSNPDAGTSLPGTFKDDTTLQGVKDMAGNVREWCRDAYLPYSDNRSEASWTPPLPNADGPCVVRGGSYLSFPADVSTTARRTSSPEPPPKPDDSADDLGFRIVLECAPDPPPPAPIGSAAPPRPSGLPYPQQNSQD